MSRCSMMKVRHGFWGGSTLRQFSAWLEGEIFRRIVWVDSGVIAPVNLTNGFG